MSFRGITQSLVALIVITTLMITVCDSLPKYCQCIESNGNQFNAFAEYYIRDGKRTEFWLYENKHKCQMFVKNKTEIVIDTSGQIQTLDENYRQWFGFYKVVNYGSYDSEDAFECRAYPGLESKHYMQCRKGKEDFMFKFVIDGHEYFNALVFAKEINARTTLEIFFLFQSESDGNWMRSEKRITFHIQTFRRGESIAIIKQSETDSTDLSVLLKDIGSNVYINAVLNAYDAKHDTKGFFIFVTNNGIPMYCKIAIR